jgi:hypothetical protein
VLAVSRGTPRSVALQLVNLSELPDLVQSACARVRFQLMYPGKIALVIQKPSLLFKKLSRSMFA